MLRPILLFDLILLAFILFLYFFFVFFYAPFHYCAVAFVLFVSTLKICYVVCFMLLPLFSI